jgi:hypothetical protein
MTGSVHVDARGLVHHPGQIPGLYGDREVCYADGQRWPCPAARANEQADEVAPSVAPEPAASPPGGGAPAVLTHDRALSSPGFGDVCPDCIYSIRIHVASDGGWLGCPPDEAMAVERWGGE